MLMKKKNSSSRAWNILRLALLWARKGGLFKTRPFSMDLRLFPKFIKSLRHHHSNDGHGGGLRHHYGERQLSFDDTPVIHVKMHRPSSLRFKLPNIPCINPHVDFDYDFSCNYDDDNEMYYDHDGVARKSFLKPEYDEFGGGEGDYDVVEGGSSDCEEGIDMKAEVFIAKFYQQMKLQRQISYLHYTEMINRGVD